MTRNFEFFHINASSFHVRKRTGHAGSHVVAGNTVLPRSFAGVTVTGTAAAAGTAVLRSSAGGLAAAAVDGNGPCPGGVVPCSDGPVLCPDEAVPCLAGAAAPYGTVGFPADDDAAAPAVAAGAGGPVCDGDDRAWAEAEADILCGYNLPRIRAAAETGSRSHSRHTRSRPGASEAAPAIRKTSFFSWPISLRRRFELWTSFDARFLSVF